MQGFAVGDTPTRAGVIGKLGHTRGTRRAVRVDSACVFKDDGPFLGNCLSRAREHALN